MVSLTFSEKWRLSIHVPRRCLTVLCCTMVEATRDLKVMLSVITRNRFWTHALSSLSLAWCWQAVTRDSFENWIGVERLTFQWHTFETEIKLWRILSTFLVRPEVPLAIPATCQRPCSADSLRVAHFRWCHWAVGSEEEKWYDQRFGWAEVGGQLYQIGSALRNSTSPAPCGWYLSESCRFGSLLSLRWWHPYGGEYTESCSSWLCHWSFQRLHPCWWGFGPLRELVVTWFGIAAKSFCRPTLHFFHPHLESAPFDQVRWTTFCLHWQLRHSALFGRCQLCGGPSHIGSKEPLEGSAAAGKEHTTWGTRLLAKRNATTTEIEDLDQMEETIWMSAPGKCHLDFFHEILWWDCWDRRGYWSLCWLSMLIDLWR